MKRILTAAAAILMCCTLLYAQTATDAAEQEMAESETSTFNYRIFREGEHLVELGIALALPAKPNSGLKIGGSGILGFDFLMTDNFSLGGEISFNYSETIGRNILYFIPILLRAGWHSTFGNLEVSALLAAGGCFENYLDRTYFGLAIEPEVGVFYKFFADWSAGISAGLFILPQWYSNPAKNATGLLADIRVGVKHIF